MRAFFGTRTTFLASVIFVFRAQRGQARGVLKDEGPRSATCVQRTRVWGPPKVNKKIWRSRRRPDTKEKISKHEQEKSNLLTFKENEPCG